MGAGHLKNVSSLSVSEIDTPLTVFFTLGIGIGVFALFIILLIATDDSLIDEVPVI